MLKLSTDQLRQMFLDFFAEKDHAILASASLVPKDDPTLLWINAGMAPLKPYFSGQETPQNPRMANSQKCIRTNDIENVGKTKRHHTFFEMLGSFSIDDYFKKETLVWGWEFLTEKVRLPRERLWVTIHPDDDEARHIWLNIVGIAPERLVEDADNFWEIGPGPCGPNSEIFFDQGPEFGCGSPACAVGCNCDRYLEIWNHVFSQYNQEQDGSYTPLPAKNIDTGMGLERLAALVQGVESNFEIDVFHPIMQAVEQLSGYSYENNREHRAAFVVIADHIRAIALAINDGALPTNEGRGYVIRRLLRRAVRYGRTLGLDKAFLYTLVGAVVEAMAGAYPELKVNQAFLERVIRIEEERFQETLAAGESLLADLIAQLKAAGKDLLDGDGAFRLYDTYGFPLDLTKEMAQERGVQVDEAGFEAAMLEQRQRARTARSGIKGNFDQENVWQGVAGGNIFIGYEAVSCPAQILALAVEETLQEEAYAGQEVSLLLDQTVFYAEAGGQAADRGMLVGDDLELEVRQVKMVGDKILHQGLITTGRARRGQALVAKIDLKRRQAIRRAHSATHLIHKALQIVLGEHAHQAGSLVEADHLRFDFSHFGPLTPQELRQIELLVNQQIWAGYQVSTEEMPLHEARARGAIALFGEKYAGKVRVVSMGDYSLELCGGTHVDNVGMIGQVRLLGEGGIGAGLRRLEALTGQAAYQRLQQDEEQLTKAASLLKVPVDELPRRIEVTLQALRNLEREQENLLARLAAREADSFLQDVQEVAGVAVIARKVEAKDMDSLRQIADTVRDKLASGVIVLGAAVGDKVNFVAMVSEDLLAKKLHAGNLIKAVAQITGGGGGGRPLMAQAGGRDPKKLDQALAAVAGLVAQFL